MSNVVARSAQIDTINATIASSASLSGVVDCTSGRPAGITMPPSGWDAANLTFQASPDNITFSNLYDSSGTEYTVTAAAARHIILPLIDFLGIRYLKIRSGTSGTPVTQSADRALVVTVSP